MFNSDIDNLNNDWHIKVVFINIVIKGTGHDICWSEKPIYHLQKQGNKHIFQNK